MNTTIAFLFEKPLAKHGGSWTSAAASVRLRALIPGFALSELGIVVKLISTENTELLQSKLKEADPDLIVVGKIFKSEVVGIIESYLKNLGKPVILDICDNHLESGETHTLQNTLFPLATAIGVNSIQMATQIENSAVRGSKPIITICDPPDCTGFAPPHDTIGTESIRVVVFGNKKNGEWLHNQLSTFPSPLPFRLYLEFHSSVDDEIWDWLDRFRDQYKKNNVYLSTSFWNGHRLQEEAIDRSDAIYLPGELSEQSYTKSENRLLVSFARGRLPICYPQPSYRKFDGCALITASLFEGLLKLRSLSQAEIRSRVLIGQSILHQQFSPAIVIRPIVSLLQRQAEFGTLPLMKNRHLKIEQDTSAVVHSVVGRRFDRLIASLSQAVSDSTLVRLTVGTGDTADSHFGVRLPRLTQPTPSAVESLIVSLNPELLGFAIYALARSNKATPAQLKGILHPTLLPEPEFYFEGPPSMLRPLTDALESLKASFESNYGEDQHKHLFWAIDRVLMHVASCLLAQLSADLALGPSAQSH